MATKTDKHWEIPTKNRPIETPRLLQLERQKGIKLILEARLSEGGEDAVLWAKKWADGEDCPWATVASPVRDHRGHLRAGQILAETRNRYVVMLSLLRQAAIQLAHPTFPNWIYQQSLAQSIECYLNSIGEGAFIPDDDMKE